MRLIDADALEKNLRREYEKAYQKFHAAKRDDEKTEYGAASVTWLQAIFRVRDADLIKALRCCSDPWTEDRCPCLDCPMPEVRRGVETHDMCDDYIMRLAADRLEELTK